MATSDSSPSLFAGQTWSDWAGSVSLSPIPGSSDENTSDKDSDVTDSMMLPKEDMSLFGQCPSQDEFYLVKCEQCNKVVKPQAFQKHMKERHSQTSIEDMLQSSTLESKSSSPSKLAARYHTHHGHSIPTKASVKEVPPHVSNAQKMGTSMNTKIKSKSKKNHTMPVVKVERMEVKRVSQHYEPVTKSHSIANGNVKENYLSHALTTCTTTTSTSSVTLNVKNSTKLSSHRSANNPSYQLSSQKETTHSKDKLTHDTKSISNTPTTLTITTTSVSTCMSFAATTTVAMVHSSSKSSTSSSQVPSASSNWTSIGSVGSLGLSGRASFAGFKLGNLCSASVNKSPTKHHSTSNINRWKTSTATASLASGQPEKIGKSHSMSCLMENLSMSSTVSSDDAAQNQSATSLSSLGDKSVSSDSGMSTSSQGSISLNCTRDSLTDDSLRSPISGVERRSSLSDSSLNSSSNSLNLSGVKKSPKTSKPDKLIPCKDREYDCNKHCGVTVEETGKSCTRSLTCKTHALSLRRKVQGRRKPFDDLLKEHRAAKEILLKQKAEQKAAQIAAAEQRLQHKTGAHIIGQTSTPIVRANSSQSLAEHLKEASQPRIPVPTSPKKSFKPPQKLNTSVTHRSSLTNLYSPLSAPLKDDPGGGPSLDSNHLSDGDGEDVEGWSDKTDSTHLPYHPRPAAMCTFGGRVHLLGNRRCVMYGRKSDLLRQAFINVLEKHMNPPPPKKLCVESNLPKDALNLNSKDPYDFSSLESGHSAKHYKPVLHSNHKSNMKLKSKPSNNPNRTKMKEVSSGSKIPAVTVTANVIGSVNCSNSLPTTQGVKRKRNTIGTVGSSPSYTPLQQQTFNVISNVTNISSHSNNNALTAIAIPSVNLSTTTLGQINANLTPAKAQKNTFYKDVGFVVTGLDSSNIVNGQYINITNTASNAQRIDDKTFQQTHVIAANKNNPKIVNVEKIPTLQKNNVITVPPFIVEGLQQGTAMLAPVSLATSLNNPLVAMTTNTNVSPSQPSPGTYRSGSCSPQVPSPAPNGVVSEKLIGNTRHNLPNAKKAVHPSPSHHGFIGGAVMTTSNSSQVCPSQMFTTQLTQLQVKPANFTMAKTMSNNKVSMQPLSLTFPLTNVNLSGVGQPTLLTCITSGEDSHLSKQVNSAPSGHVS